MVVGEEVVETDVVFVGDVVGAVSREEPVEVIAAAVLLLLLLAPGAVEVLVDIVVGVVRGEEPVEVAAGLLLAAAAGLLLAPEAMHIHVPRTWMFGLSDACAVQRRVVEAVVAVGAVKGKKNQGTEDSARKTSARGRKSENFVVVVVVVVGKLGGEEGTVDGIVTRTNPCRQSTAPFVHSHPHDVCQTTYADGRCHGIN